MLIKSCLLAAVFVGALAQMPVLAADSDTGHQDVGKLSNQPAESSGSQTPSLGADAAGSAGAKTDDDIDLRITVQPHRPGAKANKSAETKVKLIATGVKNAHRRVFSASLGASRTGRNAVSAPIAAPQIDLRRNNEQTQPFHTPVSTGSDVAGTPNLAKPETALHPIPMQPHVTVVTTPDAANHAITGTGINRRTANSVTALGGPAKTVAGINGTTLRPAH